MGKNVLLINPWIYDFAAYDYGIKPVGLLRVASHLRRKSDVHFIDCLAGCARSKRESGFSKLRKERIEKPPVLQGIERPYFRYGISVDEFRQKLSKIKKPSAVLMTSGMTYWYPGVQTAIAIVKDFFPDAPVILGGIYATLSFEHACRYSGADYVWRGSYSDDIDNEIPSYDLLDNKEVLPIAISRGCPFRCSYCASSVISPFYTQRDPVSVFEEIMYYKREYGTDTFVFYDDALVYKSSTGIKPFLRMVKASGQNFRFYTPNGIHARYIDMELATLFKEAGFRELRLSLETSDKDIQKATGNKVSNGELKRAVMYLKEAGFDKKDIGVYILVGAPWLGIDRTHEDILWINSLGAQAVLASYSPIPGTKDYQGFVESGLIEADIDPLWHNNVVFCEKVLAGMLDAVRQLRRFVARINE